MVETIDLTKMTTHDVKIEGVPVKNVDFGSSPVYPTRNLPTDGISTSVKGITHVEEALTKAGLNYDVVQVPIYYEGTKIENRLANIRNDTREFIEVVSNRYVPFQNRQAFSFLEGLINSGALQVETAGQFDYGSVWIEARTPQNIKVLGDEFYPYALVRNSHDGTSGVKVCFTFTRVVCRNTLAMAVNGAPRVWQAKHMRNIENRIEEAKNMLEVMDLYTHEYPVMAEKMNEINLTEDETVKVLQKMFPVKNAESKISENYIKRQVTEIMNIYTKTPDLERFKGTAWGFFNAVSDFATHTTPLKDTKNWKANRLQTLADGHPLIETAQRELLAIKA